jgi:aspartyl aminopeptidase
MDSRDVETSQDLIGFIQSCPSMFHTTATIRTRLKTAGFTPLPERARWNLQPGGTYFTVRDNSSIIAFKVGAHMQLPSHYQIAAVHGDSPGYKLKAEPALKGPGNYVRLNVESYGGVIDNTWLDRPLGLAGRVLVRTDTGIESRLLFIDRDVLLIPNMAIHLNHGINKGFAYNRQVDLCPLFSAGELSADALDDLIAEELGVAANRIVARDLFLVNRQQPVIWGAADEFVSAPHLDDLQGAYSCLAGFLAAGNDDAISVYACFDNEEVGSGTKQGALSTFLADTLQRVTEAMGGTSEDYRRAVAGSFLVSCDNAHAVHPNHPEMTDDENRTWLNKGVVVKEAANQKYTTDAFSRAVFEEICRRADVPVQHFANRSDRAGGSTLGNLSNTQVSVHAVDIGLPQLAMHSSFETAGLADTRSAMRALTAFFNTNLSIDGADAVTFV